MSYLLAVASRTDHGVRLIDPTRGSMIEVVTGRGPHELAVSPNGRSLYVANMGVYPESVAGGDIRFVRDADSTVTVLDLANGRVRETIGLAGVRRPHGIVMSSDGARLWVTAEEQSAILEVDAASGREIRRWRLPEPAHMVIASATGDKLYGANTAGSAVFVVDRSAGTVRGLSTGAGPEGMALRPGTDELWVASRISNTLSVIDTRRDSVITTIPTGGEFSLKLAFSRDGKTVWVSNNASGTVTAIDAATGRLMDTVQIGAGTMGVAVAPDGRFLAVADPRAGQVVLVDTDRRMVVCRIPLGRDADGVAWYPRLSPLEAARRIGFWLRSLESSDGSLPDDAFRSGSSASLAEGAAGRALFLHELARATGDSSDVHSAAQAVDRVHALLPAAMSGGGFPPSTGLYYGAPGLATVLLHVHADQGGERHVAAVREVVERLLDSHGPDGYQGWSAFNDVLFGDAGTALFLLDAAAALDDDAARRRAVDAGRALISRARPEHGGLYWVLREGGENNLPNFSHGTAGIGYLMARLYEETRDSAFLHAATGAARYLNAIAEPDTVLLRVPYGLDRSEWRERYDIDWAHGAAGTARFYEGLTRVTGNPLWRDRVRAADRATRQVKTDDGVVNDIPLDRRFGLAGIADFHLDLAAEGQSASLDFARALGAHLLERATRDGDALYWVRPRPAFMPDGGEPGALTGLLHGAAGQGLLLLRLDAALRGRPWTLRLPDAPWPADTGSTTNGDQRIAPVALVTDRFRGAEGLTFSAENRLFVTADRKLWEVTPDGTARPIADLQSTVGLAAIDERDVLVAEFGARVLPTDGRNDDGVVLRITPEGVVDTVATGMGDPNFILVRRDGSLLVSDDFSHEIWEISPEGEVALFTDAIRHPNGMVESRDGRFLYVAQIFRSIDPFEQDDRLWRLPLQDGRPAGDPQVVFRTGGVGGLDGLAIDPRGRIYIAANREGRLWRYDPADGTATIIAEDVGGLASLAFGSGVFGDALFGSQLRGGRIWRFDVPPR